MHRTVKTTFCLGGGLGFVAGIAVTMLAGRAHVPQVQVPSAPTRPAGPAKPWGHLEALRIPFINSEEFFLDRAQRLQAPRWFFADLTDTQLAATFDTCGLDRLQQAELQDRSHWQRVSNGWFVLPSKALVQGLSSAARQQIYTALARNPANYAQCFPFRFPPDEFEARFAPSGLRPDKLQRLRSLTYTNAGTLCFADVQVLPEILSPEELNRAVECLYAIPAYRLRLRLYADSDIDALVNYWGKGGRAKKIRPLLESLTHVPATNGVTITIGYLLPPFARLRLNTYPDAWTEPEIGKEDCFWTSMNFFNEQPDMRYLDVAYVKQTLRTDYTVVTNQPTYGDLVALINEKGDGLHVSVYIADDFVFTKNGMTPLQPWAMMKITDMLLSFPSERPQRLVIFRHKEA